MSDGFNTKSPITHTPVDDLESFAWVALWVILLHAECCPMDDENTAALKAMWAGFLQVDTTTLGLGKLNIIDLFNVDPDSRRSGVLKQCDVLRPYSQLFCEWFRLMDELVWLIDRKDILKDDAVARMVFHRAYSQVLALLEETRSAIPAQWNSTTARGQGRE